MTEKSLASVIPDQGFTMNTLQNKIQSRLRRKKVFTLELVAKALDCALITARRHLKKWNAYKSCNKNNRYYTLPDVPKFDQNGLWRYEDIVFSKFGPLKETIIELVSNSKSGLSVNELTAMTGISHTFLYQMQDIPELKKEKINSKYFFFASQDVNYRKQKCNQKNALKNRLPTDQQAILILVEMITNPGIDPKKISANLAEKNHNVEMEVISNLLEKHDLLKKNPIIQR